MRAYPISTMTVRLILTATGIAIATGLPRATFAANPPANGGAAVKQCTIPITIDLKIDTGKLPDMVITQQDRVCFKFLNRIKGDEYIYQFDEEGPQPPLLSWSDVSQVMSGVSGGTPSTSAKTKSTAPASALSDQADHEASFQQLSEKPIEYDPTEVQAGDSTGYPLGIGYSLQITITNRNAAHDVGPVTLTVKIPKLNTSWTTYLGAIAPSGHWNRSYSLQQVGSSAESRIIDTSQHDWSTSRLYGSLFWIRNVNPDIDWAAGFGVNGGHVAAFVGGGSVFHGVGIIYGVAYAPTDELTPQYQYIYARNAKVPSTTSISSLTTLKYRPTIFIGMGVTFCISSCPTNPNAQANQPAPAGK